MQDYVYVKDLDDAIHLAAELQTKQGYDVFRGQVRAWDMVPSLHRVCGEALVDAKSTLRGFLNWACQSPHLRRYTKQDGALLAIAQHYGIKTNLLDITSSPGVAGFFALEGNPPDGEEFAAMFCAKSTDIAKTRAYSILRIDVANLWRLQAQQGLFLVCDEDANPKDIPFVAILFPWQEVANKYERTTFYPERKSHLELALDQYFMTAAVTDAFSKITAEHSLEFRWRSYPGAFHNREIPAANRTWTLISDEWLTPTSERHAVLSRQRKYEISLDQSLSVGRQLSSLRILLKDVVEDCLRQKIFLKLQVARHLFASNIVSIIEKALELTWDGLRVWPYTQEQVLRSVCNTIVLLFAKARGKDVAKSIFGETETIEYAPLDGIPDAANVSREDLIKSMESHIYSHMASYWLHKARKDVLSVLTFCLDYMSVFNAERFIDIFCTQVIPNQIMNTASTWLEDPDSLYESHVIFDPINLKYLGTSHYRFRTPFALESDIARVLYIYSDMTEEDIFEAARGGIAQLHRAGTPLVLRFHGFNDDDRNLSEIPKAKELSRSLMKYGGASFLEVHTIPGMMYKPYEQTMGPRPLGAFGLWGIAMGNIENLTSSTDREYQDLLNLFIRELEKQNKIADSIYQQYIA